MPFRGYWDAHEEDQLRRGVQKHGIGSWERIRHDPEFKVLRGRTGVQLKDKWRNLVKFQHVGRDEAGRAPVRSFRGGYRRRAHRAPKADGGDGGSDDDDDVGVCRGPRVAPVREPEPINDFERARLENIRRNQEALAALMGGVEAIAPKISEAVAPAPRRRARPTGQSHDTEEVRSLREQKAHADMELEDARAVVEQADADISRAEAHFAAGKVPESALDEALNAKDAAQEALHDAEGKYDAACVALKAALSEEAERHESRKRSSRLEPSAPERISARVASRPKKTYAEDDVFSDDDDFRDGGLGRVIEDRRFGIYDSRRYRLPDDDPDAEREEGDEELDAQAAVVVKSYRDSATFKRRHGISLTEDGAQEEQDAEAGARGKRLRTGEAPADAKAASRPKGAPAAAPGPAPKSRSGRAKPAAQDGAAGASPEGMPAAPAPKKKKSGTRPTKAAREAAAAAAAAAAGGAGAGAGSAPAGARPEDGVIWRLQFKRGWGRTATRTALQHSADGGSMPLAPPPSGLRRELAERHAGRAHPVRGGALAHAGGGSGWGGHDVMLPDVLPRGAATADAGDDSDGGGEMLMNVPWHIGAE